MATGLAALQPYIRNPTQDVSALESNLIPGAPASRTSSGADQMSIRTRPFPEWVKDHLDIDDCTYLEFLPGEQLYNIARAVLGRIVQRSFRVEQKLNNSKATQMMEKLAKLAKARREGNTDVNLDDIGDDANNLHMSVCQLGLGLHRISWGGDDTDQLFVLFHTTGNPLSSLSCGRAEFFESLVIFLKGKGRKSELRELCNEFLRGNEEDSDDLYFTIFRWSAERQYWQHSGRKIGRPLDTVILPIEIEERLVQDMERFLEEESLRWYFQHGIPYKRSYLFYGTPGSGKTSLIQCLAAKFHRNLCFLQPTHPRMTDDAFKACIQSAPSGSIIVLEDIDALFGRDRSKKHADCPLTFSGLLNGLDGVGNPDGQIFILTTNFVDQLDDALVRSGRVDVHIEFPLATDEQLHKIFGMFHPNETEFCDDFVVAVRSSFDQGISMAAVQQHFIQNMGQDARTVIESVTTLGERLDVVSKFDEELKAAKEKKDQEEKGDAATEAAKPAVMSAQLAIKLANLLG